MNNFQSVLALCAFITVIFMMFPARAILASKPIVAILKALPINGFSKIAVAIIEKTKSR